MTLSNKFLLFALNGGDIMKTISIALGIIYIILGIICISTPMAVGTTLLYLVGFLVLIGGLWLIISYLAKNKALRNPWALFYGIITTLLAVVILFNPSLSVFTTCIILNIWIVIMSINKIAHAISNRKTHSLWLISLVFAIIFLIVGVFLIINPYTSFVTYNLLIGLYIGITLLIDGINFIIIGHLLGK